MKPVSLQFFLNHYLEPSETAKQTQGMSSAGYQTVAGHARAGLLTPYMSRGWWAAVDSILAECKNTGMHYCIWDEDYFPSGHAGGRVIWSDPALIAGSLELYSKKFSGCGPFEADFDSGMFVGAWAVGEDGAIIDISEDCGTRRQTWTPRAINHAAYSPQVNLVGNPHWRCAFNDNKHAVVWTPDTPGTYTIVGAVVKPTPNNAPDIMNPEAVRKFIEYSYEPYYERYPELFGNTIDTAFTDEPSPGGMTYPWTPTYLGEFESEHGYDLTPYIPHLAIDIDESTPVVRHHYRQTQYRLVVGAYIKQLADWCKDHKIEFTGHLSRTEWISLTSVYWPNELRTYKEMHVPCCDPLGAACAWPDASSYATGVKVVSSAVHLFGKKQSGSDALAVIGDEARLRDMKFMLDFQMVMGVNAFMLHGASYSLDGPRKDEVPPSLSYHHSEWEHFGVLNDYVAKTCQKLTGGRHICKTAVLYPSTSLYCQADPSYKWYHIADEPKIHQFVESLLSRQKDFDFIDEITLAESADENGTLHTDENYTHVILPYIRYIDVDAADALIRCARNGIKIYVLGYLPTVLYKNPGIKPQKLDITNMEFVEADDAGYIQSLYGVKVEGNGSADIFILERSKENTHITFAVNRSEHPFRGSIGDNKVNIPGKGSVFVENAHEPDKAVDLLAEVIDKGWKCSFDLNTFPMNYWHVIEQQELEDQTYPIVPPGFNLMNRETDPTIGKDGKYIYTCRFFLTGSLENALIVMDKSAITGDWQMFVNDVPISEWQNKRRFDCLDIEANVTSALRSATTPTLNVVRIESSGTCHGVHELMYLLGDFTCEYRYGHLSTPYLTSTHNTSNIDYLQDWTSIGYPTYSGKASYGVSFEAKESGVYELDLGRVEDVARIIIDGQEIGAFAWELYKCNLGNIEAGRHLLAVEVINSPGNRTRAARLPAGLLGPVRLLKK